MQSIFLPLPPAFVGMDKFLSLFYYLCQEQGKCLIRRYVSVHTESLDENIKYDFA